MFDSKKPKTQQNPGTINHNRFETLIRMSGNRNRHISVDLTGFSLCKRLTK